MVSVFFSLATHGQNFNADRSVPAASSGRIQALVFGTVFPAKWHHNTAGGKLGELPMDSEVSHTVFRLCMQPISGGDAVRLLNWWVTTNEQLVRHFHRFGRTPEGMRLVIPDREPARIRLICCPTTIGNEKNHYPKTQASRPKGTSN